MEAGSSLGAERQVALRRSGGSARRSIAPLSPFPVGFSRGSGHSRSPSRIQWGRRNRRPRTSWRLCPESASASTRYTGAPCGGGHWAACVSSRRQRMWVGVICCTSSASMKYAPSNTPATSQYRLTPIVVQINELPTGPRRRSRAPQVKSAAGQERRRSRAPQARRTSHLTDARTALSWQARGDAARRRHPRAVRKAPCASASPPVAKKGMSHVSPSRHAAGGSDRPTVPR